MTDPITSANLDGLCDRCGYVGGIVGTTCPECGSMLIGLAEDKLLTPKGASSAELNQEGTEDDGRYNPDELKTVSLDELAADELAADDDQHEDL